MALGYSVEQFYRLVHSTLTDLQKSGNYNCAMTASKGSTDKNNTMLVVIAQGDEAEDIFRLVNHRMNKWETDRYGRVKNNTTVKNFPS